MPFVTRRFIAGELIAQKYLLLHLLGRGASGEVFRARNLLAGNVLALKLLMEEPSGDPESVQRFFREARAINRIAHPNIVSVFDAGFADTVPYIAMEYLAGESLAQVLERNERLSVACVVAIMVHVLDALGAAHQAAIIHRDLKPANVFLQVGAGVPTIKLLDFGVAKIHEDGETSIKTESGMILGTPDYLSPEQITADSEIDGRSDLFAAGALLYELLSGRRPFRSPSFVTTTYRIVHEPTPPLPPECHSLAIAGLLDKALAKKREDRFASATEFADALAKLCPDESQREAALLDLHVRISPLDETQAELSPTPKGTHAEIVLTTKPAVSPSGPVKGEAGTVPSFAQQPRRKLARTWTDLPIVGKRRQGQASVGNVRGTVLLAVDRAIETRYGGDVREEIVQSLPRALRGVFRPSDLQPTVWYTLDHLESYLQGSNHIAVHDDANRWRALGYAGVETDLLTLLRSVRNQGDAQAALRAALPVLSGLFDFGRWSLENQEDRLNVQVSGFQVLAPSLHDWLAGVIEHAARTTGLPYRVGIERAAVEAQTQSITFVVSLRT